jgi:hypothetical protein
MPKPNIGRMGLALLLLYGVVPVVIGCVVVSDWAGERTAPVVCGALLLLSGGTMLASAVWLLVGLGRQWPPLCTGGIASILSGGVLAGASLTHVLPCSGPA